mmetsp:Transcript_8368/g.24052  ORF Transcript_8368/g.24052 Transcript_8368/m.24052 type:complete len:317 (+) Transcript_8368:718-1668(+)
MRALRQEQSPSMLSAEQARGEGERRLHLRRLLLRGLRPLLPDPRDRGPHAGGAPALAQPRRAEPVRARELPTDAGAAAGHPQDAHGGHDAAGVLPRARAHLRAQGHVAARRPPVAQGHQAARERPARLPQAAEVQQLRQQVEGLQRARGHHAALPRGEEHHRGEHHRGPRREVRPRGADREPARRRRHRGGRRRARVAEHRERLRARAKQLPRGRRRHRDRHHAHEPEPQVPALAREDHRARARAPLHAPAVLRPAELRGHEQEGVGKPLALRRLQQRVATGGPHSRPVDGGYDPARTLWYRGYQDQPGRHMAAPG